MSNAIWFDPILFDHRFAVIKAVAVYAEVLEYDRAQLNTKMVKEMVDETIISACTEIKHIQSIKVKEIQPNGNP